MVTVSCSTFGIVLLVVISVACCVRKSNGYPSTSTTQNEQVYRYSQLMYTTPVGEGTNPYSTPVAQEIEMNPPAYTAQPAWPQPPLQQGRQQSLPPPLPSLQPERQPPPTSLQEERQQSPSPPPAQDSEWKETQEIECPDAEAESGDSASDMARLLESK